MCPSLLPVSSRAMTSTIPKILLPSRCGMSPPTASVTLLYVYRPLMKHWRGSCTGDVPFIPLKERWLWLKDLSYCGWQPRGLSPGPSEGAHISHVCSICLPLSPAPPLHRKLESFIIDILHTCARMRTQLLVKNCLNLKNASFDCKKPHRNQTLRSAWKHFVCRILHEKSSRTCLIFLLFLLLNIRT